MINTIPAGSSSPIATAKQISGIAPLTRLEKNTMTADTLSGDATLSTLSRQLAESAARAELRDKNMDRRQLGVEASRMLQATAASNWRLDSPDYKIELPDTSDPELLLRAKQAGEYIARYAHGHSGAKNPFAGLSREQLNLIAYDDKGPYTMDERSAAYSAVCDIELEWNRGLWGPERIESAANNGRTPNFYAEVLAHYRTLEPIEQAQYPDNYESRLERQIKEASDPASTEKKDDFVLMTLFEILARYGGPGSKSKPGILDATFGVAPPRAVDSSPKPALKTNSLSPDASPTPAAAGRS